MSPPGLILHMTAESKTSAAVGHSHGQSSDGADMGSAGQGFTSLPHGIGVLCDIGLYLVM